MCFLVCTVYIVLLADDRMKGNCLHRRHRHLLGRFSSESQSRSLSTLAAPRAFLKKRTMQWRAPLLCRPNSTRRSQTTPHRRTRRRVRPNNRFGIARSPSYLRGLSPRANSRRRRFLSRRLRCRRMMRHPRLPRHCNRRVRCLSAFLRPKLSSTTARALANVATNASNACFCRT